MMAAMAVDLTTGMRENINLKNINNNINNTSNKIDYQHTAVDLSLPKEFTIESSNLEIISKITNSDDTMDVLNRLMKVTGSDVCEDNKNQIELTALNMICITRLQEMLTKRPEGKHPLPAQLLYSHLGYSNSPLNKKMYTCDYEGCGKVS